MVLLGNDNFINIKDHHSDLKCLNGKGSTMKTVIVKNDKELLDSFINNIDLTSLITMPLDQKNSVKPGILTVT